MFRQKKSIQVARPLPNTTWLINIKMKHGGRSVITHQKDDRRCFGFCEDGINVFENFLVCKNDLLTITLLIVFLTSGSLTIIPHLVRLILWDDIAIAIKHKWGMRHQNMIVDNFRSRNRARDFFYHIKFV